MFTEPHKPLNPQVLARARRLRRTLTGPEQELRARLRDRQVDGIKFRRQHPIGPYVVDFYCDEARLVTEIDGGSHASQSEFDAARTRWLEENGFSVIRFTNPDVAENLDGVLQVIVEMCRAKMPSPQLSPKGRGR